MGERHDADMGPDEEPEDEGRSERDDGNDGDDGDDRYEVYGYEAIGHEFTDFYDWADWFYDPAYSYHYDPDEPAFAPFYYERNTSDCSYDPPNPPFPFRELDWGAHMWVWQTVVALALGDTPEEFFRLLDGARVPPDSDDEEWNEWFRRVGLLP